MSLAAIRTALETALAEITPELSTEYENTDSTSPKSGPYQRVHLLPAEPLNNTFGDDQRQEQGIFQILLLYPTGVGAGDAIERAELIKNKFKRGTSLTSGGVTVHISHTPSIHSGIPDDDRYVIPVRIRYYAYIS